MKQNNIFFRYFSPVAAQQKLYAAALVALLSSSAYEAEAQVGEPFIHDPSTIALCDGKYYTFGTGEGGIWSKDGWTWQGGAVRPGRGAAPDVLKIGDRYLVAYSATGGGLGGSHRGDVLTMWNKTLDPKSPDFKYTEPVVVASSLDDEDCDAIDAGLLLDPTTGNHLMNSLIDVDRVIKFPSRYWVHSSILNKSRNRLAVSGFLLIFANVNSK